MTAWEETLLRWKAEFNIQTRLPVTPEVLDNTAQQLGLPTDLMALYEHTNGISREWLNVLPILDPASPKRTWDSIQRANDLQNTACLEADESLLRRFVVFASLDAGHCAAIDRVDGSVWYEDGDELCQTTLLLAEFIETCLKEIRDL